MTLLVGVAVALAVLAAVGPGGRSPGRRVPARVGPGARARVRRGRADRVPEQDLAGVLLAVAGRLRSGATPAAAWAAVLEQPAAVPGRAGRRRPAGARRPGAGSLAPTPTLSSADAATPAGTGSRAGTVGLTGALTGADVVPAASAVLAAVSARRRAGRATRDGAAARVHAVVTGARTAAELGAPLADVLEQLASASAADAEHEAEVTAALAGPRATARVLVALPALGLLVGAALGARPWAVLADGGVGTAAGVLGGALVAAGRVWVVALLRRAHGAGGAS